MEQNKKIKGKRFYPLLVSRDGFDKRQSDKEDRDVWGAFSNLQEDAKNILLSSEMAEKLYSLEIGQSVSPELTSKLAILVREYFFSQLQKDALELAIRDVVMKYSPDRLGDVAIFIQYIRDEILTLKPPKKEEIIENVEEFKAPTLKRQILQAIAEYPSLGNQTISQERIKIKSQPEPVRGSLFHWIKYYRDELGIGQHSTVERGQFLFRSENGLKLTATEREHLNLVLKSIEEGYLLDIDPEHQAIVFPVIESKTPAPKPTPVAPTTPSYQPPKPVAAVPPMRVLPKEESPAPVMTTPRPVEPPKFVPKPAPTPQPMAEQSMAEKFQPAKVSPAYEKITVSQRPTFAQDSLPQTDLDVSQAAEKLKREPKPEWIKGVFTKENIPDTLPIAPVAGAMSFSFNHTLPAEQETKQAPTPPVKPPTPPVMPQPQKVEKPVAPVVAQPRSQYHIRPVSRPDL